MPTNKNGFLATPGELTLPAGTLHGALKQGGVAILVDRATLPSEMDDLTKAHTVRGHLKAAGLETDEILIRVCNMSANDRGQTDHQAACGQAPLSTLASRSAMRTGAADDSSLTAKSNKQGHAV